MSRGVNAHTAIRGVTKVLFKTLTSKETNDSGQMSVSMEFWSYVPNTITATKASSKATTKKASTSSSSSTASLSSSYQSYLKTERGKAPKISDKTASSPAKDTASTTAAKNTLSKMPY